MPRLICHCPTTCNDCVVAFVLLYFSYAAFQRELRDQTHVEPNDQILFFSNRLLSDDVTGSYDVTMAKLVTTEDNPISLVCRPTEQRKPEELRNILRKLKLVKLISQCCYWLGWLENVINKEAHQLVELVEMPLYSLYIFCPPTFKSGRVQEAKIQHAEQKTNEVNAVAAGSSGTLYCFRFCQSIFFIFY